MKDVSSTVLPPSGTRTRENVRLVMMQIDGKKVIVPVAKPVLAACCCGCGGHSQRRTRAH